MDSRMYNKLDPSIHLISNSMSLNEDKRKQVNAQLSELLGRFLLPAMQEVDADFKNLFQKIHYSGSYYENLRISEPNEFDLNLELRSQKGSQKFLQVHYSENYPGFVQMEYLSGDSIKKWVNGSGFVMQSKVLYWLQRVVDKALTKISGGPWRRRRRRARKVPSGRLSNSERRHREQRKQLPRAITAAPREGRPFKRIAHLPRRTAKRSFIIPRSSTTGFASQQANPRLWRKMSGPAVTLYVEYVPGEIFSVDLVPVFVLDSSQWPSPPVRHPVITNDSNAENWCVVPKPNNHINQDGNVGTFWRMSFYNQERAILNNKNHLKNALKLMKLLRDKERWCWLSSYYLKTVFLWSVMKTDAHYWNAGIGVVFMNMMRTLKDYLKDGQSIPFFWDSRLNILSAVNTYEIQKIGYTLERIIKDIDRHLNNNNPKYIEDLFGITVSNSSPMPQTSPPTSQIPQTGQQQNADVGWGTLAIGVGSVAVAGALLFRMFGNNRE